MFFNVCLHSRSFPLRADWLKYDSSDVVVNSLSFFLPAARAPRRTCSQAMKLALKYSLRTLVFFTSHWRRDRHFSWSSESRKDLAICRPGQIKAVSLFLSYSRARLLHWEHALSLLSLYVSFFPVASSALGKKKRLIAGYPAPGISLKYSTDWAFHFCFLNHTFSLWFVSLYSYYRPFSAGWGFFGKTYF